jgi:predicted nuclease of predicted toxin-antitoxin system
MKFLLNMNLPRQLGKQLAGAGHVCRHVGDIGMARASDTEIVAAARRNRETIITHDLDYGGLLAFSGEDAPSVIIFRVHNTRIQNLFDQFVSAWNEIEEPLSNGAIVILEDAVLRIRRLPFED